MDFEVSQDPLLEREAVDVRVLDGVRVDRHLDGEAGLAKACQGSLVETEVCLAGVRSCFHEADRPDVPFECGSCGDGAPLHLLAPLAVG